MELLSQVRLESLKGATNVERSRNWKCIMKTMGPRCILLGCAILAIVVLTGCSAFKPPLTVYPIRDTDIRVTGDDETGEVIMSKWYFKNVLKVKLEEGR